MRVMMKMKNIKTNPFLRVVLVLAIVSMATFGFVNTASASYDWYDSGSWDNYSYDYYEPTYDYSYDYYEPTYDYSYDYYTPSYDYSYDYYEPTYDYSYDYYEPTYSPVSYSSYTPSYNSYSTPQYYTSNTSTYRPYTSSYSSPTYNSYTPTVYKPTQTQSQSSNNVNNNTSNSNSSSSANASSSNVNNNNNVNNINNVNNNNINVVVGTPISSTTNQPQYQTLDGSCYISPSYVSVNQDVTFTANATGGNGNYSYSWYGSDGISSGSRTFTGRFFNPGSKTATVTITSGNQSITRSCTVNVENNYNNNNIGAYCVANPTNATVGQTIVWTAYVTGGNSSYYTYSWYGTDGLSYGNAQSIQKSYLTPGTKTATVTVYGNNGQSATVSCYSTVSGNNPITVIRPNVGTPVSGVYLSQVPDTGIEANMKVMLFAIGLIIWSAFIGYVIVSKRRNKLVLSGNTNTMTTAQKIQAFKIENMRKQGLIK